MNQPEPADTATPTPRRRRWTLWGGIVAVSGIVWAAATQGLPMLQAGMDLFRSTEPPSTVVQVTNVQRVEQRPHESDQGINTAAASSARTVPAHAISQGASREHIEALLGSPVSRETCDLPEPIAADIYSFPDRYLQLVYDKAGSLRLYVVTLRDQAAKVEVPNFGPPLGSS